MNFWRKVLGASDATVASRLPFETVEVAGTNVLSSLEDLSRSGKADGYYPVLLGPHSEATRIAAIISAEVPKQRAEKIIDLASSIDPETWLKDRRAKLEPSNPDLVGSWPNHLVEPRSLCGHIDPATKLPFPAVLIGKIRVENPWEIPAHFGLRNWSGSITSEEQVALWKYWFAKHGAVAVTIQSDTIEFSVSDPPVTPKDSLNLAWDHVAYCMDVVWPEICSVSDLAASLTNSKTWGFWWDERLISRC